MSDSSGPDQAQPRLSRQERKDAAKRRKRIARLQAIQAAYQMELTDESPEAVLAQISERRFDDDLAESILEKAEDDLGVDDDAEEEAKPDPVPIAAGEADRDLRHAITMGVFHRRQDIDDALVHVLAKNWPLDRLETVMRAILRCGAWELFERGETPGRSIVREYVSLTDAFYEDREPGFVNGVLDRLARQVRPEEFDPAPDSQG
ncbi:MAG: transcription antitermination factor NusB [Alphaproteobacteria bacterium]|nr:transcription antitermination factor NusB [Alphaproteobacteria bacterium]